MTTIHLVLVRTIYPSNIGMAARALANMGGQQLILIDPHCDINSKARQGAAGAQRWLEECRTYPSWADFLKFETTGIRIGLTRRQGRFRRLYQLEEVVPSLIAENKSKILSPMYLILGPEDDGLSGQDLEMVHLCASLPTYGSFASLNLAQASLLSLFVLQRDLQMALRNETQNQYQYDSEMSLANHDLSQRPHKPEEVSWIAPEDLLVRWLTAIGFDPQDRQGSALKILKRWVLQSVPTQYEWHVLSSIIEKTIRSITKPKDNV